MRERMYTQDEIEELLDQTETEMREEYACRLSEAHERIAQLEEEIAELEVRLSMTPSNWPNLENKDA